MFVGERARLRGIERRDLPAIVRWLNDPAVRGRLGRGDPISLVAEERWLETTLKSTTEVVFAIDAIADKDPFVGTCGLHAIDWRNRSARLGIMIGEAAWQGRGIGTEAVQLLVRHALRGLGLHRVELEVLTDNVPAIRCYERVGFVSEGVREGAIFLDGAFVDLRLMRVLSTAWPPPATPAATTKRPTKKATTTTRDASSGR